MRRKIFLGREYESHSCLVQITVAPHSTKAWSCSVTHCSKALLFRKAVLRASLKASSSQLHTLYYYCQPWIQVTERKAAATGSNNVSGALFSLRLLDACILHAGRSPGKNSACSRSRGAYIFAIVNVVVCIVHFAPPRPRSELQRSSQPPH